jgi:lipoprotein NlpD
MKSAVRNACVAFVLGFALSGCMVAKKPAPVVERAPEKIQPATRAAAAAAGDQRPDTYVVKRGDTLYGIALDHGQDYRDIARWSNLADPNSIEVGQVLRVRDPATSKPQVAVAPESAASQGTAVTTPYQAAPVVEEREVGSARQLPPSGAAQDASIVNAPLAVKVPYSDAALAKLRAAAPASKPAAEAPVGAAKPAPAPPAPSTPSTDASEETDGVAWSWPARGRVVANFNENGGPKGLQIAGEMGQPVLASAEGRVVYTGSGLRGYGNLVIIKHNNTYLSAYAHNRAVLVKQGDNVVKGQKIAEMGNSDANRVMLHFEIRRLGKPVDPIKFLPPA